MKSNISPKVKSNEITNKKPNNNMKTSSKTSQLLQLQSAIGNSKITQLVKNKTGMPDSLKTGIENLSGIDMSDVSVKYNSSKPAQLNAHAYTAGSDIHVGPGQEKHLAHEAWHVVQQKQGRVKPTTSINGQAINDNKSLEKEADVMGQKATQMKTSTTETHMPVQMKSQEDTAQLMIDSKTVNEYKVKLGISEGTIVKVLEVLNDKPKIGQKLSECKANINAINLSDADMDKTFAEFCYPGLQLDAEMLDSPAEMIIQMQGNAAYSSRDQIVYACKEVKERDLFHELGHYKQDLDGFNVTNANVIILEYHNVILHENEFEEGNLRTCYNKANKTYNTSKTWDDLKGEVVANNKTLVTQIEAKLQDKKYEDLRDTIKSNLVSEYYKVIDAK